MPRIPHVAFALLCGPCALAFPQDSRPAWPHAARLHERVEAERVQKRVPGIVLAIAQGGRIVHTDAFGHADAEGRLPLTPEARVRAGSVSKLFTAVALLQLVEQGKLGLDDEVRKWLPEFRPANPFATPLTLRHLMTHHGGLVREPAVGSYFHDDAATLEQVVASLATTTLRHEPGSRFQYSNAGPTVLGLVLDTVAGAPFAERIATAIAAPLALTATSFVPAPTTLPYAEMWTYDGRRFRAPRFPFGIAPAAALETTVGDLVRFGSAFCTGAEHPLLGEAMLREAFTPQLSAAERGSGIGLAFFVHGEGDEFRVGHNGAVYGFATELAIWPRRGLAIAAVATLDCANGVAANVVAMAHALATGKEALPAPTTTPPERIVREAPGRFAAQGEIQELEARSGRLLLRPTDGLEREIRATPEGKLIVDDVFGTGPGLRIEGDTLHWEGRAWKRLAPAKPELCPAEWKPLLGEYGWEHDVLYVLERDGRLQMLVEWFEYATLHPTSEADVFRLDARGLYANETVRFRRDPSGRVTSFLLGVTEFARRNVAPEDGVTFRITPQLPIAELREAARRGTPPAPEKDALRPDLVELVSLEKGIRLDLRYATEDNFLGTKLYEKARALLQRPAAEAVVRAHRSLAAQGYGLLIHDAYRPWSVTKMFWDATPPALRNFVADPSRGSRHNRGCAVDLTLYDLTTGAAVEMVSGFDEFTPRAWPDYPGGTSLQRWHRALLRRALEAEGFTVYEEEWWHFDYHAWRRYPVLDEKL